MKNKIISFLAALFLTVSATNLPVYAARLTALPSAQEGFYQQLANLVSNDDYSKFFGEMELQMGSRSLMVDGKELIMDTAPEIVNDRTMLPIRAVVEAAGAKVVD